MLSKPGGTSKGGKGGEVFHLSSRFPEETAFIACSPLSRGSRSFLSGAPVLDVRELQLVFCAIDDARERLAAHPDRSSGRWLVRVRIDPFHVYMRPRKEFGRHWGCKVDPFTLALVGGSRYYAGHPFLRRKNRKGSRITTISCLNYV